MQEGESNYEETKNERKATSKIPPLEESFVKEASSKATDEQLQISKEESKTGNTNDKNETTVQNDSPSVGEEGNSVTEAKQGAQTAANTNNTNDPRKNSLNEISKDNSGTHETFSENTEHQVEKSNNVNLHIKQDFSAINVGPEYTGDDVQPLEENSEGNKDESLDGESESEDESEDDEEGDGDANMEDDDQTDDIRAAYGKSE